MDYRFLLANERTFLAYVRTALALQIAGLGVLQFLTHGHDRGALPARDGRWWSSGSYVGDAGYRRYHRNERAIRAGEDLTSVRSSAVVAAAVIVLPLVAAVALALIAIFSERSPGRSPAANRSGKDRFGTAPQSRAESLPGEAAGARADGGSGPSTRLSVLQSASRAVRKACGNRPRP